MVARSTETPRGVAQLITPKQQEAWFALLFVHASVTERIDAILQQRFQLSFSAFEIMCRLKEDEPQSVRRLADQLVSISPTRASRVMQDLVDAGHLQRGADQGDGRRSLISFTPGGRRYAEEVARVFEEAVQRLFIAPLDDDDIAAITRIWAKLRAAQSEQLAAAGD